MHSSMSMGRRGGGFFRELGWSGVMTLVGVVLLLVVLGTLFPRLRPPTVAEVERDIWSDWARFATDSQGLTLADLILEQRKAAGRQLVETLGKVIENEGERFVVRTQVRYVRVRETDGTSFAEWTSRIADESAGWRDIALDLVDPEMGKVGYIEVGYRFFGAGLESLPNIRRLEALYNAAQWLVGILASVVLIAALANLARIRERANRLRSQEITLELAHQMCHELRNGLWAFALEGKNLDHFFRLVTTYLEEGPAALAEAANRAGLSDDQVRRLERGFERGLNERGINPAADLLPAARMAEDSRIQIESFSRYLHLTVEELDRNLLGATGQWELQPMRLHDAWSEACLLLEMRFRSAGVTAKTELATDDDWVIADRRALIHVFVNLIKNAVEAMRESPEPRELRFGVSVEAGHVRCQLHNRGRIIPPEQLPKLFLGGYSSKRGPGRGTGLALVRQTVVRLGGSIGVSSSEAEGTRFTLVFPQARPPKRESTHQAPVSDALQFGGASE